MDEALASVDSIRKILASSNDCAAPMLYDIWAMQQTVRWGTDQALVLQFFKKAAAATEYRLVCDAAESLMGVWDGKGEYADELVEAQTLHAKALVGLGSTEAARDILERCLTAPIADNRKPDIYLELGHVMRFEAVRAQTLAERMLAADLARDYYTSGLYLADNLGLTDSAVKLLVLVAASTLIVGAGDDALVKEAHGYASRLLRWVNERHERVTPTESTRWREGVALAVLGRIDDAHGAFKQMCQMLVGAPRIPGERRWLARAIAEGLGKRVELFDSAFPKMLLAVFAGHLVDPPQAGYHGRFPPVLIDAVRESIEAFIGDKGPLAGLSTAAAGADLLFAKAMIDRNKPMHLVLPYRRTEFRESVKARDRPGKSDWVDLFDTVLAKAATIREMGDLYAPDEDDDVAWAYAMEVTAGLALDTARTHYLDVLPVVYWNHSEQQLGKGGTVDAKNLWKQLAEKSQPATGNGRAEQPRRADLPLLLRVDFVK